MSSLSMYPYVLFRLSSISPKQKVSEQEKLFNVIIKKKNQFKTLKKKVNYKTYWFKKMFKN